MPKPASVGSQRKVAVLVNTCTEQVVVIVGGIQGVVDGYRIVQVSSQTACIARILAPRG
jgi:hypothetical protein